MTYTFGIIGCQHGHISMFISEMLELGHTCAGIFDDGDSGMPESIARRFGLPLVRDRDELLSPSVQIIGSSAVNNRKIDVIELCERHGKHVMLDKPIVSGRGGLDRLANVFGRGAIQVGMLLPTRFKSTTVALKRMAEAGELGDLVSISMRKPHKLTPSKRLDWHFSKEQNGGIIVDLLVHDFDYVRWLTGKEFKSVQSIAAKNILPEYPHFYDVTTAQIVLEGGGVAQLYADWHTPEACWSWGDCRIFVVGTRGSAELRMSGDPAVDMGELMFSMTHDQPFARVDTVKESLTMCGDFINRIEGRPSRVSHRDLLLVSQATVEADERAVMLNNIGSR